MRPGSRQWMAPTTPGRCTVCGAPLEGGDGCYWVTKPPDGVHNACRPWETEPFPFGADLEHLRRLARTVRSVWRELVRDGRWLASSARDWPLDARSRATEWLERKLRLQHHLERCIKVLGRLR